MLGVSSQSAFAHADIPLMDFESYETTPYLFRYGNKGKQKMNSYKPRWVYAHEVVDNPVKTGNASGKVLEYTTMEARNYGLKFRFIKPVPINELQSVSFKIYQPANVIGKPVDTQFNSGQSPASMQRITVALMSDFNSVCDFRIENSINLIAVDFTKVNEWVTFRFVFNKNDFTASALNKFANGIKGFAILPTYLSYVTLAESNIYTCYIDDISINDSTSGIAGSATSGDVLYYAGGQLHVSAPARALVRISVYELSGALVSQTSVASNPSGSLLQIPIKLVNPCIVKAEIDGKIFSKVILPAE
jgi:hypothetical protein